MYYDLYASKGEQREKGEKAISKMKGKNRYIYRDRKYNQNKIQKSKAYRNVYKHREGLKKRVEHFLFRGLRSMWQLISFIIFHDHIFGERRSYLTHLSTSSMLPWRKLRVSRPTQIFNIEVSPCRTDLRSVVPVPSWRRIGRELREWLVKYSMGQ